MKFSEYLILTESSMGDLKQLADDIIDQMAEENTFDHDAIIRIARNELSKDPDYRGDARKIESALNIISNYINESVVVEGTRTADRIQKDIDVIKDQITTINRRARARGQATAAYAPQLNKLRSKLAVLKSEKERAETYTPDTERGEFWKRQAERAADPELKKKRFAQEVGRSVRQAHQEKKDSGMLLLRAASALERSTDTNGRPDLEKIAMDFGKTPRTISKWLEPGSKLYDMVMSANSRSYPKLRAYLYSKR